MPRGVYARKPRPVKPLTDRFRKYAPDAGEGCWEWTGPKVKGGYGSLVASRPVRRMYQAHRLAFEFANGPIPEGLNVLHRCDNPPCIRPDHLFIGTQGDNIRDMFAKGRGEAWKRGGVRRQP